jgi:quinol monooxygenase YgiN
MLVVHATFPLAPEKRDEALEHVETLVEQSRAEPGVLDYRAAVDVTDPNVVRITERYEDAGAFEAHSETEHFGAFEAALPDLLGGEPTVHQFEVSSMTELEL